MSTGAPPAPTPVHPALYAALTRKQKTIRWSLVLGGAAALGLVALIILVSEANIGVLPLAILLALFPVPYYVAFALWIDRYEPEPRWLLTVIFLWGALLSFGSRSSSIPSVRRSSVGPSVEGQERFTDPRSRHRSSRRQPKAPFCS